MNGTITKRKLSNGRPSWGYVFDGGRDPEGKRIQLTKSGYKTQAEASDALRNAIAGQQAKAETAGEPAKPSPVKQTFTEFFARWLDEYANRRCQRKTMERYRELGRYAVDRLGTNAMLDSGGRPTKEHPQGKPLSARTVRHIAFTVHGALQTAVRWELLEKNPMDRVELPKFTKKEPRVLDKDKLHQLLEAAAGTRLFPLLMLAAGTGCRRGELLALKWDDIDFDTAVVSVTKSLEETNAGIRIKTTKSGKPRRFKVPQKALNALTEHRVEQDRDRKMFGRHYQENSLIFCRPDGAYYKPDKVSVRVTELSAKAGLEGVGLHSLRHSHASELLSDGVPIPVVSKRLGHANPNITLSIYSHALAADELAAAKIWDDAMVDVISSNKKREPKRMLEIVSAKPAKKAVND